MSGAADVGYCPVKLGMMSNRLQSGVNSLQGFREDKRNRITQGTTLLRLHVPAPCQHHRHPSTPNELTLTLSPVSYINYGPFTSFGPTYDSSFANISKEESDLIYSSYADESSLQGTDGYVQTSEQTHLSSVATQMFH